MNRNELPQALHAALDHIENCIVRTFLTKETTHAWDTICAAFGSRPAESAAPGAVGALPEITGVAVMALVAGPINYHHKMDEHAVRESKAFDRCRDLTIQNIKVYFAARYAMSSAALAHKPDAGGMTVSMYANATVGNALAVLAQPKPDAGGKVKLHYIAFKEGVFWNVTNDKESAQDWVDRGVCECYVECADTGPLVFATPPPPAEGSAAAPPPAEGEK
jgi:hypothetical protein